jgi:hypothetical protein
MLKHHVSFIPVGYYRLVGSKQIYTTYRNSLDLFGTMNVIEQAREMLRQERATCAVSPVHRSNVTLVMHDKIFVVSSSQPPSVVDNKAFMDEVRRLGELAQVEFEKVGRRTSSV